MLIKTSISFPSLSTGGIEHHLEKKCVNLNLINKTSKEGCSKKLYLLRISRKSKLLPVSRPCMAVNWTNAETGKMKYPSVSSKEKQGYLWIVVIS